MKKILIVISIFLLILVIILGIRLITNPLVQSEEEIRENMLKETPMGTQMEDVIEFLEGNEEWEIKSIRYENGFYHQGITPRREIGEKSIRVHMGYYRAFYKFFLRTDVSLYYGFDENGELIEIWVRKMIGSL
ncbi:hypothetical protein [Alkalibacillus haloalkaliphilus]|uniref:Uncharacterized protein n=1 Tax=Alkalibacillus haloalkaliphilus TaxID=94136 RepID=A0A511W4E3_9BACI|nr:hypothetical protein [Alkalibacillus haloalkaliphilus]GEN45959.1 hypothetical protein AHA02nite_17350 [Alkalibacillus haloalkaliphilus]